VILKILSYSGIARRSRIVSGIGINDIQRAIRSWRAWTWPRFGAI